MTDDLQDRWVQRRFASHEVDELVAVEEPEFFQRLDGLVEAEPRLLAHRDVLVVAELAPDITAQAEPEHATPGEVTSLRPGHRQGLHDVHQRHLRSWVFAFLGYR